jgi:site-specific recombinase XerD
LRLGDLLKREHARLEARVEVAKGKMTFGNALGIYRKQFEANSSLKPRSISYRKRCMECLVRSWPGLTETDVRKISERDCQQWAARFAGEHSAGVYNNTVGTLRHVFEIAIADGARYGNPALAIKKLKVRQKELKLPERDEFLALVEKVRHAGSRFSQSCAELIQFLAFGGFRISEVSQSCAELIQFLAFGGFRISEAATITWADCDFEKKEITVRGDLETGTKNWTVRWRLPALGPAPPPPFVYYPNNCPEGKSF